MVALAAIAASGALAETAAAKPDLVVTKLAKPPGFRAPGAGLALSDTTANGGRRAAAASRTAVFLSSDRKRSRSDLALGGRRVAKLARGARSSGRSALRLPAHVPASTWFVLACADADRAVRESNERNNCRASSRPLLVDSPPPAPNPLSVTPALDPERRISETVGKGGGTVTTTGADGTTYELEIPPNALAFDEQISLTPLVGVGGLPVAAGITAGVDLGPDGLRLFRPATLTIDPPGADPPPSEQTAFSYLAGGKDAHLYPLDPDPGKIAFRVLHFSGYGFGHATGPERASLAGQVPRDADARAEATLGELIEDLRNGTLAPEDFTGLAGKAMIRSFFQGVLPAIERALSDQGDYFDGAVALQACTSFRVHASVIGLDDYRDRQYRVSIEYLNGICDDEVRKILRKYFDQAHSRCVNNTNRPLQLRQMASLAHEALIVADDVENVLGSDYLARLNQCRNLTGSVWIGTVTQDARRDFFNGTDWQEYRVELQMSLASPHPFGYASGYAEGTWEASSGSSTTTGNPATCQTVEERHIDASGSLAAPSGTGPSRWARLAVAPTTFETVDAWLTGVLQTTASGRRTETNTGPLCISPGTHVSEFLGAGWSVFDCPPYPRSGPNGTHGYYYVSEGRRQISFECTATKSETSHTLTISTTGVLRLLTPGFDTPPG